MTNIDQYVKNTTNDVIDTFLSNHGIFVERYNSFIHSVSCVSANNGVNKCEYLGDDSYYISSKGSSLTLHDNLAFIDSSMYTCAPYSFNHFVEVVSDDNKLSSNNDPLVDNRVLMNFEWFKEPCIGNGFLFNIDVSASSNEHNKKFDMIISVRGTQISKISVIYTPSLIQLFNNDCVSMYESFDELKTYLLIYLVNYANGLDINITSELDDFFKCLETYITVDFDQIKRSNSQNVFGLNKNN